MLDEVRLTAEGGCDDPFEPSAHQGVVFVCLCVRVYSVQMPFSSDSSLSLWPYFRQRIRSKLSLLTKMARTSVWCTIGCLGGGRVHILPAKNPSALSAFAPPLKWRDEYDKADRRDIPVVDVRNKPNAICEPFDILMKDWDKLNRAIQLLKIAVKGGNEAYIHCNQGRHRAVVTVIYYLVLVDGESILNAKERVLAAHDNPATALIERSIDTIESHRRGMNGVLITGRTTRSDRSRPESR
jgi:hypothetical protein